MKKPLLVLSFLLLAARLPGQEIRTEIVNPAANPADDAKPNSPAVPAAYALEGKFERVVIVRLKYQTDLLGGLAGIVKQQQIRNAVILAAIGSVRGYHYHTVSNREFPSRNIFVKNPAGPADLVSMNGYVIDGRVHAHVSLANDIKAFGGHLEPGTEVFTFAIVTLGVMGDQPDFSRLDDKTHR